MCKQFKHVYAFEPIEEVRQCLAKNVGAENYSTYSFGLGAKNDSIKVNYNPLRQVIHTPQKTAIKSSLLEN